MRQIVHPGIPEPQRAVVVPVMAGEIDATLAPGSTLLDALHGLLSASGAESAALRLTGGAFDPFSYVMPAASPDDAHVAWFSDRFEVSSGVQLAEGSVTFGLREGQPWLHCHAIWTEPGGVRRCGHLLPDQVVISKPIQVTGCTLQGGAFEVVADDETNFTLFEPRSRATLQDPDQNRAVPATMDRLLASDAARRPGVRPALAVRLRPNVDVCQALEEICAAHGYRQAVVHGGVGSVIGTVFDDDRVVTPIATEMLIREGRIGPDAAGATRAKLDVALVDQQEAVSEGRLRRGDNPVLITFELVLTPV